MSLIWTLTNKQPPTNNAIRYGGILSCNPKKLTPLKRKGKDVDRSASFEALAILKEKPTLGIKLEARLGLLERARPKQQAS